MSSLPGSLAESYGERSQYRTDAIAFPPPSDFPIRKRKKFILCFDGTGNKFSGTDADSNILKIFRMLDRNDGNQFHYYQPGIGTYVNTQSLSHKSTIARIKSSYVKAKDSAIGSSFDQHVMGGYKFLMRYYTTGDDIYFFGFSRGAYIARFLAEMLDHIGLLSSGNEEMARFAWKTFQKWQTRQNRTEAEKEEKKELLRFMCAFRETFSRPIRRIRFLGLFDTVNSVPHFEGPWMERSKFPYTARSTAKYIRHAVSIDERRAKFRQDLISQKRPKHSYLFRLRPGMSTTDIRSRRATHAGVDTYREKVSRDFQTRRLSLPENFRDPSETVGVRFVEPTKVREYSPGLAPSSVASASQSSLPAISHLNDEDSDEESEQNIQEVWFAGCHADIGGGWPAESGEHSLSHVPLAWMVREAQKAGLNFDPVKLQELRCGTEYEFPQSPIKNPPLVPDIEIIEASPDCERDCPPFSEEKANHDDNVPSLHDVLHMASVKGKIHDVLCFKNGAKWAAVFCWNVMEYLPFRRMDLQADGSWKSISWPLPKGEVRDIPYDAVIHSSVINRMKADSSYRPGNLICGGGGRGTRRAPPELGIGSWKVFRDDGPVGKVYVRLDYSGK